MKKPFFNLFRALCVISSILFGYACSDKEELIPINNTFEVAEVDLVQNFSKDASEASIQVDTKLPAYRWTISSNSDWCKVSKSEEFYGNRISITVEASGEEKVREAVVTVISPDKSYKIAVSQLGFGRAILLKSSNPKISAAGERFTMTVTTNIEYTYAVDPTTPWIKDAAAGAGTRALMNFTHDFIVDRNPNYEARQGTITFKDKQADSDVSTVYTVEQEALSSSTSDVIIGADRKVKIDGGKASQYATSQGENRAIAKCWDGIKDKNPQSYLAFYGAPDAAVAWPVTLEFFFNGDGQDIDYIDYYARTDVGNGNFKEFDLFVKTKDHDYELYKSYDFAGKAGVSRVNFATTQKNVTAVKFSVKSGQGNNVECNEMEFFQKSGYKDIEDKLLTVFTDLLCTELKEDVTDAQIYALPGYFANLAVQIKNDTYDPWEKEFRLRSYDAYSKVEEWANTLMTKKYSDLDNPMGIYVTEGDTLIVLVDDIHGQDIALQSIAEVTKTNSDGSTYQQTANSGEKYPLSAGINKIGMKKSGMLFLMYNTDITTPKALPIRIHIPVGSGVVNGFFDLKEHQTDAKYAELLSKATYKYFCVRGERIMFYFHRAQLNEFVPNNILAAINLWDDIINWQQQFMGIDDVRPSQVNNHMFAISPEGSYMWASDYQIGFINTYLGNILLPENVNAKKDNAWGPAHEIGHIHQAAINWPGCTESSNNLFSNYTLHMLGRYCSRGSELSELAQVRCIWNEPWVLFRKKGLPAQTQEALGADGKGYKENTELHMRLNWQLWNYYHRCKHKENFWQEVFREMRNTRIVESQPGEAQMKFAKAVAKVANTNLTEYFELWGFLDPLDVPKLFQYTTVKYTVTQKMIDDLKAYMATLPAPKHAIQYLEDRRNGDPGIENYQVGDVGHHTQFVGAGSKITGEVSYTLSGARVTVDKTNGKDAVAYEIRKDNEKGKLLYFSNFFTFDIPSEVKMEGAIFYAVQADGKRIQMVKK